MKILIVAMSSSIHTARWISQIANCGWDIHLFPSQDLGELHSDLHGITVYHSFYGKQQTVRKRAKIRGVPVYFPVIGWLGRKTLQRLFPKFRAKQLAGIIDKIVPDIIHSMEFQHAGYLTLEARELCRGKFPPWIVTNWGSDLYLFGRLAEHEPLIRQVLENCDFYSCECQRDVCLAKGYGFSGTVLPVFPNTGGFKLGDVANMRQDCPVSARRLVMLKGYQHFAGRALVGIRALERCADILGEYEVAVYSATPEVMMALELFERSTGVKTTVVPRDSPHNEILSLHGRARISIGLSISDAISTSLLEAMVMGSFPIQSWTACADEWIEDGKGGFLVPPEDPEVIEQAIRRALTDDSLVDRASEVNLQTAQQRLSHDLLRDKTIDLYRIVAGYDIEQKE